MGGILLDLHLSDTGSDRAAISGAESAGGFDDFLLSHRGQLPPEVAREDLC